MNNPILSIVIPTNNREKYSSVIIQTILKNLPNTQLVVSDTSSENTLEEKFRSEIDNDRFKYVKLPSGLDMVSNFENAFRFTTGDYIVFIGDDDGVCLDIEKIAAWAKRNKVDSIYTTTPVTYYWKGFQSRSYGTRLSETMLIKQFKGNFHEINTEHELESVLSDMGSGLKRMPRIYHGMASRAACQGIIDKYGSLYGGVSPDMYSAILLSVESKKTVCIDFPVIIPGSSAESASGLSALGRHVGSFLESDHMKAFKDLKWDNRIPAFYSVQTVWGFTLLKAYEKIDNHKYRVELPRLYAKCLLFHRGYYQQIVEAIRGYSVDKNKFTVAWNILYWQISEVFRLSTRIIKRFIYHKSTSKNKIVYNIDNISDAMHKLQNIIDQSDKRFFYKD